MLESTVAPCVPVTSPVSAPLKLAAVVALVALVALVAFTALVALATVPVTFAPGRLVNDAPLPENVVAVIVPVTVCAVLKLLLALVTARFAPEICPAERLPLMLANDGCAVVTTPAEAMPVTKLLEEPVFATTVVPI